MSPGAPSDPEAITAVLDRFDAVRAEVASLSFDALTAPQRSAVKDRLETVSRRQAAVDHRLTHQLTSQASPVELGGKSWTEVLSNRLRIGRGEARRRLDEADDLGPRTAMTGEPLAPALPTVAAAQAAGTIGAEHVRIIRRFFADLPAAVDIDTRQACEVDLAQIAAAHIPDALRKAADRLMALVHPDGDFSDVDRARRRALIIGKQQADGMSKISGLLDPEARATFDAVLAKLAAPGMCNPDDDSPVRGRATLGGRDPADARTPGPTQPRRPQGHEPCGAGVGEAGQLNGLPVTVVVSTTLQELESGVRASGDRHRNPAADADRHQAGRPRVPLFDDLRQRHRPRAASGAHPPHRLCRPTHRAAGQGPRLHPPRLYGGRGALSGPSRGQ